MVLSLHFLHDTKAETFCFCGLMFHCSSPLNTSPDFRQCLIYDSNSPSARLIGVEYMVPRHIYATLSASEQQLWHSHDYEVRSGMLILPTPSSHSSTASAKARWEKLEHEALAEVTGWYGKTFHFWQLDRGDELPLGMPVLMGSLTESKQADMDAALKERNERLGVDHRIKAEKRKSVPQEQVHENADSWWEEAKENGRGCYA